MTAIWMGLESVRNATQQRHLTVAGDKRLAARMQTWLGRSPFAKERKLVA